MVRSLKYEFRELKSMGSIASPKWKDRHLAEMGYESWVIPYSVGAKCDPSLGFPIESNFLKREDLPVKIWAIKKGTLKTKPIKEVFSY